MHILDQNIRRRGLLIAGIAATVLTLPGCANLPAFSLTEAVRRLLTISSQNAFAELLQPNGFFDSQVARLSVPESLGRSSATNIASAVLRSKPFQDRLLKQVNRAAEKGAELAAPVVADTIRNMSIADAAAIIKGGDRAATSLLQNQLGDSLVSQMLPGISSGLKLFDDEIIGMVISQISGVDMTSISRDISAKASDAIYNAIGAQEAAIRADPRSTNDPVLIGIFGLR